MAIQPGDVYRGRRKYRSVIAVIISVLAAFVIIVVVLFYSLQKYIVYDNDGLSLVLPFMETAVPDDGQNVTKGGQKAAYGAQAELVIERATFDEIKTDAGNGISEIKALFVPARRVNPADLAAAAADTGSSGADALVLEMKPAGGQLAWASATQYANSFGTSGTEDLSETISAIKEQGIYLVAQLSCFADELMATRNSPIALKSTDGDAYADARGKYWLDPYNNKVRQYIIELMLELEALGFDEILLADFQHPEQSDGIVYSQVMTAERDTTACISNNALKITEYFEESSLRVSVLYDSAAAAGESQNSGQDAAVFFGVFDRLYCEATAESLSDCSDALRPHMKSGDFSLRFVPIMSAAANTASWVITE